MHEDFKIQYDDRVHKVVETSRNNEGGHQNASIQSNNAPAIGGFEGNEQMPGIGGISMPKMIDEFQGYGKGSKTISISMVKKIGEIQEIHKETNLTPSRMSCFQKSKLENICKSKVFNQQKVKESSSITFLDLIYEKNNKTAEYEVKDKREMEVIRQCFFKKDETQKEIAKQDNFKEEDKYNKKELVIQERSIIFSNIMKIFENKGF